MLNRLLQDFYQTPNNGRQVIQLEDRRRILVTHSQVSGPSAIDLRMASADSVECLADFDQSIHLIGPNGILANAPSLGLSACLLQHADQLHLVWTATDGIYHAAVPTAQALEAGAWTAAHQIMEGTAWSSDFLLSANRPCLVYHQHAPDPQTQIIGVAFLENERWSAQTLWHTGPLWPPVASAAADGRIYMAWGDAQSNLWYGSLSPQGRAEAPPLRLSTQGQQPSIALSGSQVLIVYEDRYPHIHFMALQDGVVTQQGPITWKHPWFMGDLVHSPQLATDRHGITWCFFVDNTRRSIFWTRWMGTEFGAVYNGPRIHYRAPHFDWNLLPIGRLALEKNSRAADIGMLLSLERPLQGQEYRRFRVPNHPTQAQRKVLFLDGLELSDMQHVEMALQEATRHPANPLLNTGPKDSFDSDRVFNHGTVIKDGPKFRMWYGAIHAPAPGQQTTGAKDSHGEDRTNSSVVPWWDTITCGYAESTDGIHWEKVPVGLADWRGNFNNNLVPLLRHSPMMLRDDAEPNPARRYKSLFVWNSGELGEIAQTQKYNMEYDLRDEDLPVMLYTSPDGTNLTPHPARLVFHDGTSKPFSIVPQSFFRDPTEPDPAKRWKAYGFATLNLRRRGGAFFYSADALTWYAHAEIPILDPSVRGIPAVVGGPESQIHDTVVFRYAGYYLALYQYQHNAAKLDIELAMSRDGETFVHIQPGAKVLGLSQPGSWDSEHLFPTTPVVLDDQIRLYYGGGQTTAVPPQDQARLGEKTLRVLPGLATLRKDGFSAVRLCPSTSEGYLTTLPFQLHKPRTLRVNAHCDALRRIKIEILNGRSPSPIKGYEQQANIPLSTDGLTLPVQWQQGANLPTHTPIRIRFHFEGDHEGPHLYSYQLS